MYSIDSSSLLEAWTRRYPPDIFPAFWEKIEELIQDDILLISQEVYYELEKKDDDIFAWLKDRKEKLVITDEDIQEKVAGILTTHRKIIDTRNNRSGADPFVIAVAIRNKATVVTEETPSGNEKKPKIPDVCMSCGVEYINMLNFIRKQSWIF